MKKTFVIICSVIISINVLLLSSCSVASQPKVTNLPTAKAQTTAKPEKTVSSNKTDEETKWMKKNDSSQLPLIASLPEKNIRLYSVQSNGVALFVGDYGFYYAWTYLTPRTDLPKLSVSDYDNDGKDELAAILYLGGGTGVHYEELHVLEISKINDFKQSNHYTLESTELHKLKDNCYNSDSDLAKIKKTIKLNLVKKSNKLIAEIKVGKKQYYTDVTEVQTPESGEIDDEKVYLGDYIQFENKGNILSVEFGLGISTKNWGYSGVYIGAITAVVNYKEEKYSLSDLKFEEY